MRSRVPADKAVSQLSWLSDERLGRRAAASTFGGIACPLGPLGTPICDKEGAEPASVVLRTAGNSRVARVGVDASCYSAIKLMSSSDLDALFSSGQQFLKRHETKMRIFFGFFSLPKF